MTDHQKRWLFHSIGISCAVLILVNLTLAWLNSRLNRLVLAGQSQVSRTQMIQNTMQTLINRVGQESATEPSLRALLVKHRFALPEVSKEPPKPTPAEGEK